MIDTRFLCKIAAVPALAALVSGCGLLSSAGPEAHLVPDEPGLYAVVDDELQRLDGDSEWEQETWGERSVLPPDTEFVVRHPSLADGDAVLADAIGIYKVTWIRSEISPDGGVMPVTESQWGVGRGEQWQIPASYSRPDNHEEVIKATPQQPLGDGLYALELQTATGERLAARLGINWATIDRDRYAAEHCVDRYRQANEGHQLRPCEEQQFHMAGRGLQVHLVDPQQQQQPTGENVIEVQGVVVNRSEHQRPIPPLTAEIRNAEGEPLKRWQFMLPAPALEPGESIPFKTQTETPEGANSVHVSFGQGFASDTFQAEAE